MPSDDFEIDEERVDEAVLAVLYLTLHDTNRAWKGIDFDVMNRLHDKGLIGEPWGKTKSVVFSDEGLTRAEEACRRLFGRS